MSGSLAGKVALITGAARGQGAAHARLLVESGARVAITDVLEAEGQALADELGEAALFLRLDVTSEDDWAAAVRTVLDRFGRIDILVNNAGVAVVGPIATTSVADYRRVVDINQLGVFLGMRSVIPAMTEAGGGSIINISSVAGLVGLAGNAAYAGSKYAVRGLSKAAAMELAPHGIRVNSVHPGFIDTDMLRTPGADMQNAAAALRRKIPAGRMADAAEVAPLIAYLASDDSRYCTGAEFVIDGGFTTGVMMSD